MSDGKTRDRTDNADDRRRVPRGIQEFDLNKIAADATFARCFIALAQQRDREKRAYRVGYDLT